MEEPDEVVHYLQMRYPKGRNEWYTKASGTAEEVERALRSEHELFAWHQQNRAEAGLDPDAVPEVRVCRVERFYGPVIRLGATIAGQADVAGRERRTSPPSEQTE